MARKTAYLSRRTATLSPQEKPPPKVKSVWQLQLEGLKLFVREAYSDPFWKIASILLVLVIGFVFNFMTAGAVEITNIESSLRHLEQFESEDEQMMEVEKVVHRSEQDGLDAIKGFNQLDHKRFTDPKYFPTIRAAIEKARKADDQVSIAKGMVVATNFSAPALAKVKPTESDMLDCIQPNLEYEQRLFQRILSEKEPQRSKIVASLVMSHEGFAVCGSASKVSGKEFVASLNSSHAEAHAELAQVAERNETLKIKVELAKAGLIFVWLYSLAACVGWLRRIHRMSPFPPLRRAKKVAPPANHVA